MPAIEGLDPVRSLRPIVDAALQALQPADRGKLGVDVPPPEHRGPKVGRIHQGKDHWAQVVFGRVGHRVGAGLFYPDHWVCESKEEGDVVVGQEGAAPTVVGRNGYRCVPV